MFVVVPAVILAAGIATAKLINKYAGVALCCISIFLFIAQMHPEGYFYVFLPLGTVPAGVVMLLSGVAGVNIHFKKRREAGGQEASRLFKRKPLLPISVALIIVGIAMIPSAFIAQAGYHETLRNIEHIGPYEGYPVTKAAMERDVVALEGLLQNGADPNEMMDDMPLMKRIILTRAYPNEREDILTVVQLLLEADYNVNETYEDGTTLLMLATIDSGGVSDGYDIYNLPYKLTELFVSYGADVNAIDDDGRTALMWSCNYRGFLSDPSIDEEAIPFFWCGFERSIKTVPVFYYDQIRCLVENGADVGAQDKNGYRAIDYFKFAMDENSKNDIARAIELYQSQEYIDMSKAIEELLQY